MSRGMFNNQRCYDDHECRECGQICQCGTYTWACPWRNGPDADALCGHCAKQEADLNDWESDEHEQ